jgi:hypothetical protein
MLIFLHSYPLPEGYAWGSMWTMHGEDTRMARWRVRDENDGANREGEVGQTTVRFRRRGR